MTKNKVLEYLIEQPLFRERKNKDRGIVNLLVVANPKVKDLDKDTLVWLVRSYATMDRAWRLILDKERPDLRGADYGGKERLEQEKQLELGYEVGLAGDNKKLKNL